MVLLAKVKQYWQYNLMEITQDQNTNTLDVAAYDDNSITIADTCYANSLLICDNQITHLAHIKQHADITSQTLTPVLESRNTVFLLGTGKNAAHTTFDYALLAPLMTKNIGFEIMNTQSAIRTYQVLCSQGTHVSALFIFSS